MDYDPQRTGGYAYIIEFPDSTGLAPMSRFYGANNEGIQRLEMLAILDAANHLVKFAKENRNALRDVSGVVIHTDRYGVSDSGLSNPYIVRRFRRNKWTTKDAVPVKHSDLHDGIFKARAKLVALGLGRVEIVYTREKKNKTADKLSRKGKADGVQRKRPPRNTKPKVGKRLLVGSELKNHKDYFNVGDVLLVHPFYKVSVTDSYEIKAEILVGDLKGCVVRIYVTPEQESKIHRKHAYEVVISRLGKFHVEISKFTERDEVLDEYKSHGPSIAKS